MRLFSLVIMLLGLISFSSLAAKISDLEFITEQYAPFNYQDSMGKRQGFAIEILAQVWKKLGVAPQPIRMLPWARGYALTLQKNNTVLFSTTRIHSREKLFKWACPISYIRVSLMGRSDSKIKINSLEDAKKYKIVAIRSDVGEQLLLENNFDEDNIHLSNHLDSALRMVMRGRVDLISSADITAYQKLIAMGEDPELFKTQWVLESNPLCFAFNRNVDDALVEKFSRALSDIQGDHQFIYQLEKKYRMVHD
ncbi:substrate-binding periplasmic protein [Dongshaea marina]|uniref:substrate-binding periplasmic protein n=1 Tax=Dongshaea marina TaxID=2047966 RepID=UPI000D3E0629|nr:transporter substrate-binding domain-containing protein [Dongshaea marina]